jgi:hypothetical protein
LAGVEVNTERREIEMGKWRFTAALGFVSLLATLVPGQVLANHGWYHGYCDANGNPVLTEPAPDSLKDFHPECEGLDIVAVANDPLTPGIGESPAAEQPGDFAGWVTIRLNGKRMINPYGDVMAYLTLTTSRTLVPIRMVTEGMGGTADWNGDSRQVTIRLNGKYMVMRIGDSAAEANGRNVTLDQPPLIWKDRTMVPLRVIMEAFGADVQWVQDAGRVEITLTEVTCAPGYCLQ